MYSKILYSHFFIEHIKGHHKHVGTPLDPATAKLGEALYPFVWRSFIGSYKSVWDYEKCRLENKKTPISAYSLSNRMISFNLFHLAWILVVTYF